jgi:hypothetical protein
MTSTARSSGYRSGATEHALQSEWGGALVYSNLGLPGAGFSGPHWANKHRPVEHDYSVGAVAHDYGGAAGATEHGGPQFMWSQDETMAAFKAEKLRSGYKAGDAIQMTTERGYFVDDDDDDDDDDDKPPVTCLIGGAVRDGGMEVLAYGEESDLLRACADCGQVTGRFCETLSGDGDCMAATWIPNESWAQGQRTPLCSSCDWRLGACHFCRKVCWATPPKWQQQQNQEPQRQQQ